jgi:hypothetical protein
MKSFKFYEDPGHGWLAVKRKLLSQLGVLPHISSCSYEKGQTIYLEEDRDAGLFIQAFVMAFDKEPQLIEKHTNKNSFVRYLKHYEP